MAGYLGTRAVLLSTTAAVVTGDMTVAGDVTVSGAFTSLGIDDNATSTAITIDASENVGIGTDSPAEKLHVKNPQTTIGAIMRLQGAGPVVANGRLGDIDFWGGRYSSDTGKALGRIRVANEIAYYWNGSPNREDTYMSFSTGKDQTLSEAMRISSSGSVLVGKTTADFGATAGCELDSIGLGFFTRAGAGVIANRLTVDGPAIILKRAGTDVGSIDVTASATSYNTSSDYRLKENVTPIQGAADVVMAMQPCTYTAKADGLWYDGFLAHELQEIHPRAVQGTKDAMQDEEYEITPATETEEAVMGTRSVPDMQSVDYSKLTPILTAALQEALTEIAALKVRVAALEVTP